MPEAKGTEREPQTWELAGGGADQLSHNHTGVGGVMALGSESPICTESLCPTPYLPSILRSRLLFSSARAGKELLAPLASAQAKLKKSVQGGALVFPKAR